MRAKLILPALAEAGSPLFRPIKYSLFPPLGLATLAAHFTDGDEVELCDGHVQPVHADDTPDLVAIEVYVTNAREAYRMADAYRARRVYVCLGGLHVTSCPDEAALHADSVFLGPGDESWPRFLTDFRAGNPQRVYRPAVHSLCGTPAPRRDLIDRRRYLVQNALVISRGCPHACDFCYKAPFFAGGPSFYHRRVDEALSEIDSLPGRHLFFLDDHLFGDEPFARTLFSEMRGAGRVWQAAATVQSVLRPGLVQHAATSGLRSLFVGFESISSSAPKRYGKLRSAQGHAAEAVRRLHENGVMVNASFVFGLDGDGPDVFDRTVEWALEQGVETATFHILTPYPGTALHTRLASQGRILTRDWDLYDTRHAVFEPAGMTRDELEAGYRRAYRDFYSWRSLLRGACRRETVSARLRRLTYRVGWKKVEPLWHALIRVRRLPTALPLLESVLDWGETTARGDSAEPFHSARSGRRGQPRTAEQAMGPPFLPPAPDSAPGWRSTAPWRSRSRQRG